MLDKKTTKLMAIAVFLVVIIGGFVVYAALSQTLNIQGNASMQPESWDVRFKSGSLSSTFLGRAKEISAPILTGTSISDYKVSLSMPGDKAIYTF